MKKACAGMAMGLVKEGDKWVVLTDIMGMEDHLGDMDFKVAGTVDGVTALQMDIKIEGISIEIMKRALEQAKRARLFVLGKMNEALDAPWPNVAPRAPHGSRSNSCGEDRRAHRSWRKEHSPDHRRVRRPGGRGRRRKVYITALDRSSLETAKHQVESYAAEAEVGKIYKGTVVRIMPKLGAFVEIMPGKDGLVHISQLDVNRVEKVEDAVNVGDEIEVKVLEIDRWGESTFRGKPC